MNPPKVVIFDLGKVLLDFDYRIAARKLIRGGKVSLSELSKLFTTPEDILIRYETGLVTTQEFYKHVCELTGYSEDIDAFAACFGDIFSPMHPIIEAHAAIRKRGIPTYILSNTNELAMRHIRACFPFIDTFNGLVLSYEHKAMKPGHAIYQVAERVCGHRGADILYIDDRAENVATAVERGWRVILQEDQLKTICELRSIGALE